MQCPRCQFDNPEGSVFCGKCGSSKLDGEEVHQIIDGWFQDPDGRDPQIRGYVAEKRRDYGKLQR